MSEARQVQGQLLASNWTRGSLTSQVVKGQRGAALQVLWCQVVSESCQVWKAFLVVLGQMWTSVLMTIQCRSNSRRGRRVLQHTLLKENKSQGDERQPSLRYVLEDFALFKTLQFHLKSSLKMKTSCSLPGWRSASKLQSVHFGSNNKII